MQEITFEVPKHMPELLSLLNASKQWHISVIADGRVEAFARTEWGSVDTVVGEVIEVLDGDQLMFSTKSEDEAKAFLYGCFLATFNGRDLSRIHSDLQRLESH